MDFDAFRQLIKVKGDELYRDMPWRRNTSGYYVLVSELMLQQTQVSRVVPKFESFMELFPTIEALAEAPLSAVLQAWSGLGYNRRAKYLHEAARQVCALHAGEIPMSYEHIKQLPGIGPGTAGAIMAYAFNQPILFIETNIRTVYIHHFFAPNEKVSDARITPLLEATIDTSNPREFYWALMDYGSWLKQRLGRSANTQSVHYKAQTKFSGSVREIRGQIVRLLGERDVTVKELQIMYASDERLAPALEGLIKDRLVAQTAGTIHLTT